MSAKKGFQTKIRDDENTDSGFLSGPISEQLTEDVEDTVEESDSKIVTSDTDQIVALDSGLDLSEGLDSLHLRDATPTPLLPQSPLATDEIPPLAILFQQDEDGDTQLHIAAFQGCEKSVSTLIRVCPDRCWMDLSNDYGYTALHLAVLSGHAVVARMLVRAGAALGARDLAGDTPLHAATSTRQVECLQALLAPIENQPLHKKLATVLNQKNYAGQTCVHLAASSGHLETLQTLVYYGADINAREGMAGWTALHIAARRGDVRLAQYLVQRCPGVALGARDYAERTPRRLARRSPAFATREGQRLFAPASTSADSDSESEDEDEYDSDGDIESLFDRLRGNMSVASLVTN